MGSASPLRSGADQEPGSARLSLDLVGLARFADSPLIGVISDISSKWTRRTSPVKPDGSLHSAFHSWQLRYIMTRPFYGSVESWLSGVVR